MLNDQVLGFLRRAIASPDTPMWFFLGFCVFLLGVFLGFLAGYARRQPAPGFGPPMQHVRIPPRMLPRRRLTYQLPHDANDFGELQ